MDKLKTRVLFVALIILALVSVSAVAAADVDDVVSAEQEDIDLSEETVSDVESAQVESAQETDILTEDEPAQNPDGSSYITVKFSYMTEDGPVEVVNQSLSKSVKPGKNLTITYSHLLYNKPPASKFNYMV